MHYKKILAGGVTAAAILGAGGTALAVSGSDTTPGQPAASSTSPGSSPSGQGKTAQKGKKSGKHKLLRGLEHGQFVTHKKDGTVTHNIIRGTVSAVSATSITVQAMDKKSVTFTVTKDTKVRVREDGKGTTSTMSQIAKGDRVVAAGTGTSTITAKHVVDIKGMKKQK